MTTLATNMNGLLKSKADADDLIKLFDIKTNKEDTQQNMRNIKAMHRMLQNLAQM